MATTSWTKDELAFLAKARRITQQLRDFSNRPERPKVKPKLEKSMIDMTTAEDTHRFPNPFDQRDAEVLLIQGNVHLSEPINQRWVSKQVQRMAAGKPFAGVIVDGNLRIDGDWVDDFRFASCFVTGDVECDSLYSKNSHIVIEGSLKASQFIMGEYNDGSLQVKGSVSAPYLLSSDHDMPRDLEGDYIYIEGASEAAELEALGIGRCRGAPSGWGWHYFEDCTRLLIPELCVDGEFDLDGFTHLLRAGKNPFFEP